MNKQHIVIVSVSSDFGLALADHWLAAGHDVTGTFRTSCHTLVRLKGRGLRTVRCDLLEPKSVASCIAEIRSMVPWDALVLCPGAQEPVGSFVECDFDEWARSTRVNFLDQMRLTHALLPSRNRSVPLGPLVLYFAGGGTNNATVNYSAYTISKIALIKMCELLDAEVADTRFTILGPGWVKTKIHQATLRAGTQKAGDNYHRTVEKLTGNECNSMERVVACCDWVLSTPREVIGGRNFSVVFDPWGDPRMDAALRSARNLYKLRRFGNDFTFQK